MIEKIDDILKRYYGYSSFREGQKQVIESILGFNDTFAIMPTGAGKSICYQLPATMLEGITLVISPLISLMKDQIDALKSVGIEATFVNSSINNLELQNRLLGVKNGEYKLLYIAPERLESEGFCEMLSGIDISLVAVDEAHCVSQWGHDFRPSYSAIPRFINRLEKRPVVAAFTATATTEVKNDVIKLLKLKESNTFVTGFDRKNLSYTVTRGENKKDFILNYIRANSDSSGIIYGGTRKEVDSLCEYLNSKGLSVGKYHAGLSEEERSEAQESFIYDNTKIIVATNAFGMGIDKSNVRFVIHYTMPKNMEAYYQEAGRAGRDGENSECILLFNSQDVLLQKFLIEQSVKEEYRINYEYKRLQLMVDYCHTPRCLRKYILEYFGEKNVPDNCANCSTCKDEREVQDITIDAQKIFSCVYRVKERFGTTVIAEVLRGSKNKNVLDLGFDKLSTYGIMKQYTVKEIKDLINVLIAEEYLCLTESQFPVVRLKEKAVLVLKSKEKVYQKIRKKTTKQIIQDNSLFAILKEIRKSISIREKVPPYIVFSDITLREMSEYLPSNEGEMLNIKGVGQVKFERYGKEFLEAIAQYIKGHSISENVQ